MVTPNRKYVIRNDSWSQQKIQRIKNLQSQRLNANFEKEIKELRNMLICCLNITVWFGYCMQRSMLLIAIFMTCTS